jgi:ubiquitin-protein ligase
MARFIKKLMKDYDDIRKEPIDNIKVICKEDNIYDCYCLLHGLSEDYEGGEYIFNIKLSTNHPMEPPNFFFLTPNGRFTINKKLCFSNSGYHKEAWSPIWNLRTIILGFLSFFLEKESTGIGHINNSSLEKKIFANTSKEYNLKNLSDIISMF